jgi:hypothetical protein
LEAHPVTAELAVRLTKAHRRLLRAICDAPDRTLIYCPHGAMYGVGKDGIIAQWATWAVLEQHELIVIERGPMLAMYVTATDKGRRVAGKAASFTALALRAEQLATEIGAACARLDGDTAQFGWHLDDGVTRLGVLAADMRRTAADLERFAARPADPCPAE